jgi:hypothetical protein
MNFDDYLKEALAKDDELRKEYKALDEWYDFVVSSMRESTPEERQSIQENIDKISKPTGVNFWELLEKK